MLLSGSQKVEIPWKEELFLCDFRLNEALGLLDEQVVVLLVDLLDKEFFEETLLEFRVDYPFGEVHELHVSVNSDVAVVNVSVRRIESLE